MKVPWSNPWIDKPEKKEVDSVFESDWFGMGPRTREFENRLRAYIGVKHALAVSNGTVALDLALKAIGIKPGDEVIVPAMTYIATVSSVLYQHAVPVFADIELDSFNIDPVSIRKLITRKTKCIMYIDYGGNPADHYKLKNISDEYAVPLVQDGAQSLGGEFKGEKLCKQGLICTTSFHIAKLMTTIEGGMVFTEDDQIAYLIRMMRNQGEDPEKKYIHMVLGTNARMTDLQAAIGLRQIEKFGKIVKRRQEIADHYCSRLSRCKKIRIPVVKAGCKNAWFFVPILVKNRDSVARELRARGVDTRIAYPMPVYSQPFFAQFKKRGFNYDCRNAEFMTQRVLNLPIFHRMTQAQLDYVTDNVIRIVEDNA